MALTPDDEPWMREAIAAARAALDAGDAPYGAVLVAPDGRRLWSARNRQVTGGDCTAHAEMLLVREASAALGAAALRGATVYASGEPCAMCAGAMYWAGIGRVVFAASQAAIAGVAGGDALPIPCARVFAGAPRPVAVDGPLLAEAACAVLAAARARPVD